MATLAVFVQLAVWGATKIRSDGALLETWQPCFGGPYGLLFALCQVGMCRWLLTVDGTVALVPGLGALVPAAGLFEGRLVPTRTL